jgi:hypothetical protein
MAINQPENSDASPLTNATIKRHYDRPPSFTDLLPWMEYIPECKAFLLEDGVSLGALFEVTPVGCEATHARVYGAAARYYPDRDQ